MGVRLQCAKCHHHPFESYGQDDYYGLAAYFARIRHQEERRVRPLRPRAGHLRARQRRGPPAPDRQADEAHARSTPRPPTTPSTAAAPWRAGSTAQDNPWLARNVANRYWGYLMGKGLVNPIDDLRETNPPTNPELLDALADEFVESGYDLKTLLRLILTSRVYQLSAVPTPDNRLDTTFFTHYTDQAADRRAAARRGQLRDGDGREVPAASRRARGRSRCPTRRTRRTSSTPSAGPCGPSPASASGRPTRTSARRCT